MQVIEALARESKFDLEIFLPRGARACAYGQFPGQGWGPPHSSPAGGEQKVRKDAQGWQSSASSLPAVLNYILNNADLSFAMWVRY